MSSGRTRQTATTITACLQGKDSTSPREQCSNPRSRIRRHLLITPPPFHQHTAVHQVCQLSVPQLSTPSVSPRRRLNPDRGRPHARRLRWAQLSGIRHLRMAQISGICIDPGTTRRTLFLVYAAATALVYTPLGPSATGSISCQHHRLSQAAVHASPPRASLISRTLGPCLTATTPSDGPKGPPN